ncbi:zinc-binding dehydrogenase [Sphingomonas echinoides]|jgi:NADPH:quinone reductase-like Zn-dependent oxidoreductase|uniref:zinc-binding dehydrogenase n=1 Tax=Sphingomonas echinoides TaxID=59803 RepID=UPI003EEBB437
MTVHVNRKILIRRAGGPDRLELVDAPMPECAADEVIIRNEAVGVAFADVLIREGLYPGVPLPATPGYEAVGIVVSKGRAVDSVEIGARVAALTVHRGYARYVNVPAAWVVAVPPTLDSPTAASLVLNGLTAIQMLTRSVALPSTQSILIWGAAGGVGSILLDLARHFGVTAYGVASGARTEFVARKGGVPIDRSEGDVSETLKRYAPAGVDAVFDGVGGPNVAVSQRCLNEGGMVVMFGIQGGLVGGRRKWVHLIRSALASPRFTAFGVMKSNRGLKGYMVEPLARQFPDRYRSDLSAVLELAASGAIAPQLDEILPMSKVAEAHRRMNAGTHQGKIVLDPAH